MGFIFALIPTVGWSWPALAPILTAVAAGYGYRQLTRGDEKAWLQGRLTKKMKKIRRETVALDEMLGEVIAEDLGTEQRMAFQRDDMLLVFRKDARGKFFVDVSSGEDQTGLNLRLRGEEFARELVRKFAYHKMMAQIEQRGAVVVDEEVTDRGETHIRCRQWN